MLVANEKRDRLELLAQFVIGLGHDVIAREIEVKEVHEAITREHPDVALVGLGESSGHALSLISEIVREASCPVIAILHADDPAYIREAARRGVFAHVVDHGEPVELQNAIEITLQRFAEYQNLQGAFDRRAVIEQAKGILMARYSISSEQAFDRLRDHSSRNARKLVDVPPRSSRAISCSTAPPRARSRSHLRFFPDETLPTTATLIYGVVFGRPRNLTR